MPLVRIDTAGKWDAQQRRNMGEIVYRAMTEVLKSPVDDKFQVIVGHGADAINVAPEYLGIRHSGDAVLIQITLNIGRTTDQKRAFYRKVAEALHSGLGVRTEDVIINLVEVAKENWSFGNGDAPYA